MKRLISILVLFSCISTCRALPSSKFNLFVGFGELYSLASVRVGIDKVEVGMFNIGVYGLTANFANGNTYYSFGPIIKAGGGVGLYGAAGYDFSFMRIFYIKGELNAASSFNNQSIASALIGAGLYW